MNRRFETDYAGAWRGHCVSRKSAIIAAVKHIVNDGYTTATITDKHTGTVVARVRLSDNRTTATIGAGEPFRKTSPRRK